MKKILLPLFMLFAAVTVYAQTQKAPPQYINYQAVLRDKEGKILANKKVVVEFQILKYNGFSFDTERAETHTLNTTDLGLINLNIGKGSSINGLPFKAISAINWADSLHLGVTVKDGQTGLKIIEPTSHTFASTPYTLYAQHSVKADTAKVALQLAGSSDINGKFVGVVQIFGMNEGAAYVQGKEWKRVTKTIYDHIEALFGDNENMGNSFNKLQAGMKRQYYLIIRKADDVNLCAGVETLGRKALGSEWRFYLTWQNKAGHKFQLGRNSGPLSEGSVDWIKIPPMESYPDFKHPMYWHLEARMNPNCPDRAMQVFSVHVAAYDFPISQPVDSVKVNIDTDNKVGEGVDYVIGGNILGTLKVEASRLKLTGNSKELKIDIGTNSAGIDNPNGVVYYEVAGQEYHVFGGNILSDDKFFHGLGTSDYPFSHAYIRGLTRAGVLEITGSNGNSKELRIDVGTNSAGISNPNGVVYYEVAGQEYHVFGGNILSDDKFNHGLGTSDYPFSHAYVRGLTRTGVLEITGGDVAEARHSNTGEQLAKGSVVVFDEAQKGKVRLTNKPYDKKVAGVISGAGKYYAGITLLQEELQKGAMPVAQIGTVEVLTIGPVEVGDLLTTSEFEGYAKVATDATKAFGCIIGKATTTLKEGERGLVEMQIEKH